MSWGSSNNCTDVVDSWLTKPVSSQVLFNSIYTLFSQYARGNVEIVDPLTAPAQPHPERKGVRVLVVEDNPTNQDLIAEQLGFLGYTVQVVDDAAAALMILAEGQFEIVLMDCELPGMNGYDATAEIRRREVNGRHLTIIAFTAHVAEDQKQRCLDAGMDGYLAKPLKLKALADSLDAHFPIELMPGRNLQNGQSGGNKERLDPATIAELAQLSKATGHNVFRRLADRFISDLSRQVDLVMAAIESTDMPQLALAMHSLKSSSAIVGATDFSAVGAQVEQCAREGKVDLATSLAKELLEAAKMLPGALLGASSYSGVGNVGQTLTFFRSSQ